MPTKKLPASPNLDHLKSQARDLMADRKARSAPALQRIREFHPNFATSADSEINAAKFTLADAQWTIAREYGFASWPRLKSFVETAPAGELDRPLKERIEDPIFRKALERLDAGDLDGLKQVISEHPDVVHRRVGLEGGSYFRNPSLLEFSAENPVRKGTLPENIVDLMALILDAGGGDSSETLGLVCSGRVPRESGFQAAIIDLLCRHGADPDSAMPAALGHGEFAAAKELLNHGAALNLAAAAAMGRTEDAFRLLSSADAHQRHAGLAYASMFSELDIVRRLLEEGEDPNRFNPMGIHSHSTPLHQAAICGDPEMVELLLKFGARADIPDTVWGRTAIDWAEHGGQSEIVDQIKSHLEAMVMNNGPMTAQEIVDQLSTMGRESYRKTMLTHGVHEPIIGVSIGDMQPIRKKIKKEYQLAKDLYATGIYDAMYLGGLVADEKKMTASDLEEWMARSKCHAIATSTVAAVAAESAHGWELGLKWIDAADTTTQCAGWASLSGVVSLRKNDDLDLDAIRALMQRIASSILGQTDGIVYSMNNFVISVGAYVEPLAAEAMRTAEEIGKLSVKLVGDCKMPFAPEYITRCQTRGSLGKKKKMVRC